METVAFKLVINISFIPSFIKEPLTEFSGKKCTNVFERLICFSAQHFIKLSGPASTEERWHLSELFDIGDISLLEIQVDMKGGARVFKCKVVLLHSKFVGFVVY